ncbi:MAG: WGR domain-containing protein [Pirellula sp.]|nr:WGR domain-containing protein [Pirellula sp.]
MKLHLQIAGRRKRDYKSQLGSLPIDQAFIQLAMTSIQQFIKEDGQTSSLVDTGGKLPKTWHPEWVRAADLLRFSNDWTDRAFAIRGVEKDIARFAQNVAWDQRVKLGVNTEYANLRFRAVWNALNAAAVQDWAFVKLVADNSRKLISGSTCYHNVAKAVFLLIVGDMKKAAAIAKQKDSGSAKFFMERQSIAFTRALCNTIVAAADKDLLRVAHGLKLALVNIRDREECALQALGLAAILRRIDPNLLSEFDGSRLDAWDDELWAWTESNQVSFSSLDLRPLSHELHETLIDLKEPQWLDFKGRPSKAIRINMVPAPEGIPEDFWVDYAKKYPSVVTEYFKEQEKLDHFINYRKLNKKKQPEHAFDWMPSRTIEQIRESLLRSRSINIDDAIWFEKSGKTKSTYWAINQFETLVTIFVDPLADKDLFEIRKFQSPKDAAKFAKERIEKQKAKGFTPIRKQNIPAEKPAATKVSPRKLNDPNQQAVAEFWQAFGVPKLQAQKIAKKAASDFEKQGGTASIIKSMNEKAKRKEEWQKEQKKKQKEINRETAALERELKNASKTRVAPSKDGKLANKKTPAVRTSKTAPSSKKSSGARRFELIDGKSSKFWTVQVVKDSVVTQWGRIGSAGQTTTKSYSSNDKAQSEMDKLIREKTGKGYQQVK